MTALPKPHIQKRSRSESLVEILETIEGTGTEDTVTLGEILRAVGRVSFAPMLIVPAIALATPLSGIPLFSATMGILIFLVSVQIILRRDHLWLPGWLLRLSARRHRVHSALERTRPVLAWLDRRTHSRLTVLVHRPLVFIPQLICVLSGLCLPLLEFVPFSSSLVGVAVALLGIGMLARDGLVVLLGLLPYIGIAFLVARLV